MVRCDIVGAVWMGGCCLVGGVEERLKGELKGEPCRESPDCTASGDLDSAYRSLSLDVLAIYNYLDPITPEQSISACISSDLFFLLRRLA